MADATPRPWTMEEHEGIARWYTVLRGAVDVGPREKYDPIAHTRYSALHPDEDKANAELIVRAVNAHDELVAALEDIAEAASGGTGGSYEKLLDRIEHIARGALIHSGAVERVEVEA